MSKKLFITIIIIALLLVFVVSFSLYLSSVWEPRDSDEFKGSSVQQPKIDYEQDSAAQISSDLEMTPSDDSLQGEMNALNGQIDSF